MAKAGESCDEPWHKEEEGCPHQDVLGIDLTHGDHPFADRTMALLIRTPPGQDGLFLEHVAACYACLARVTGCWSPRRGNVLLIGWLLCPERANVSPIGA
jgi:hypothetical protein